MFVSSLPNESVWPSTVMTESLNMSTAFSTFSSSGAWSGLIVDAPLSKQQHRDYIVQASFKNGGMLAAFVWMAVVGSGWVEWSAFALFYVLNVLGESLGHHRYFGHGAFKTSTPMRYALAILAQSGAYGSALYWVADHRRHHAFSDREGDPHSPWRYGTGPRALLKGMFHAHIGWLFDCRQTNAARYAPDLLKDVAVRRTSRLFIVFAFLSLAH